MKVHNIDGEIALFILEKITSKASDAGGGKVVSSGPMVTLRQSDGKKNTAHVTGVNIRIVNGEVRGDIECELTDMASVATIDIR